MILKVYRQIKVSEDVYKRFKSVKGNRTNDEFINRLIDTYEKFIEKTRLDKLADIIIDEIKSRMPVVNSYKSGNELVVIVENINKKDFVEKKFDKIGHVTLTFNSKDEITSIKIRVAVDD